MKGSKFPKKRISLRASAIPAVIMMLLIAGLSAPVFADGTETVPKDEDEFLSSDAYAQEDRFEGLTEPQGLVSIPVTGLIVPTAAVAPPPSGGGNGSGATTPTPPPNEEEEEETIPISSGSMEQPPKPPDREGGEWRWDEDLGQWIFEEANPLADMELMAEDGNLPQTGFAGILADIPRPALALLAALLLPAALILLLRRRQKEKAAPETPGPAGG
jgi:hypothetical protein